jgi:hypothetical protein
MPTWSIETAYYFGPREWGGSHAYRRDADGFTEL